jgi:hypothetical protein
MRHILNVLRFLIFIPLCLGLLHLIYWAIGHFALWLITLSIFWLIVILFFGFAVTLGIGMYLFGFLASMLSYVNPYKKVGGWIVIPIAIIFAIFNIVLTWKILDLSYTRQLVVALMMTALIFYVTMAFSVCISSSNPKQFIEH